MWRCCRMDILIAFFPSSAWLQSLQALCVELGQQLWPLFPDETSWRARNTPDMSLSRDLAGCSLDASCRSTPVQLSFYGGRFFCVVGVIFAPCHNAMVTIVGDRQFLGFGNVSEPFG